MCTASNCEQIALLRHDVSLRQNMLGVNCPYAEFLAALHVHIRVYHHIQPLVH